MELAGRVALVTGAGQRLGQAIALALGAHGAHVAVHYHGSALGADETVARLRDGTGRAEKVSADLSDAEAPARLIDEVVRTFGRLDLLVNSAAIYLRTPLDAVTVGQWDQMFAINLRAPFFLSVAAAPALRERSGAIVNIADLAAFETWPEFIPHGITKAGVVQMTRALARALAPGVRVNAVAPGAILLPAHTSPAEERSLVASTPLGRIGDPADVCNAVLYLASADFVTGETLMVDGGRHIRR